MQSEPAEMQRPVAEPRAPRVSVALPLRGHCRRDHPFSSDNLVITCLECHREGDRLRRRLERVQQVLEHHVRACPGCEAHAECADRRDLEARVAQRRRALAAWRSLGGTHVDLDAR